MSEAVLPPRANSVVNKHKTPAATFLTIPSEIRILIYQHLFHHGSVALLNSESIKDDDDNNGEIPCTLSLLLGILLTNKLCHDEAKPIFYNLTTFHLKQGPILNLNGPTCTEIRQKFDVSNAQHVSHVFYSGSDPKFVFQLQDMFPNLKRFEMSLGEDFFHSDQTNFDRAMRCALRYGDWKFAVKNALDDRFPSGMRDAVARLRHLGPARGFTVTLHWGMAYRFVDFRGVADLDEGVLRIRDPEQRSSKVYDVAQNPLEPTWCEGRLTLPHRSSDAV